MNAWLCQVSMHMYDANGSQKKTSNNPLELELRMVVSCHVSARNTPRSSMASDLTTEQPLQPTSYLCMFITEN